jgi:hypothetical protein
MFLAGAGIGRRPRPRRLWMAGYTPPTWHAETKKGIITLWAGSGYDQVGWGEHLPENQETGEPGLCA